MSISEDDTVMDVIARRPRTFLVCCWLSIPVAAYLGHDFAAFVMFVLPVALIPEALEDMEESDRC